MKNPTLQRTLQTGLLACALLATAPLAQQIAFPGAEGNGRFATGGRGGDVYTVTNLNDAGPGSFREAVSKGNRTVVFAISGYIALKTHLEIAVDNLTIAGQTAPGGGIGIKDRKVTIKDSKNVIIRYMKFRPGDLIQADVSDLDALAVWGSTNIIIDHCSMGWSIDAVLDLTHQSGGITVQWSLVHEALFDSYHEKGPHSMGSGIDGNPGATSYHHNLLASSNSRMPRFDAFDGITKVDFVNNVVYNWGANSSYGGEQSNVNFVNNYYKPGPSTGNGVRARLFQCGSNGTKMYIAGNYMHGNAAVTADNIKGVAFEGGCNAGTMAAANRFDLGTVRTQSAEEAFRLVLDSSGSSLPGKPRDAIDQRIVDNVRNGTGKIIDSQTEVGSWNTLAAQPAPVDTDKDGIPDSWERANGLDANQPADGKVISASGYSNLERYLESIVHPSQDNQVALSPWAQSQSLQGKQTKFHVRGGQVMVNHTNGWRDLTGRTITP